MENYKAELTSLKEELNSRIDAVIAKIEKPKRVSGWYVDNSAPLYLMYYDFENNIIYGIGDKGEWIEKQQLRNVDINEIDNKTNTLATPTKVQEALTKEAVKRELVNGNKVRRPNEWCQVSNDVLLTSNEFYYYERLNSLNNDGREIFRDGIWATPIKTKTIEELVTSIKDFHFSTSGSLEQNLIKYFSKEENKQTIIETLNNL